MKRVKVISHMLAEVGYDEGLQILQVKFQNDSIYDYQHVPKNVYTQLLKEKSIGKFFVDKVKNVYTCKIITA
jgi:hypothetical protein